jgi:hypothetical protein
MILKKFIQQGNESISGPHFLWNCFCMDSHDVNRLGNFCAQKAGAFDIFTRELDWFREVI